jgi:signal transduction histidine kinase
MIQTLSPDVRDLSRCEAVSTIYSRLLGTSLVNTLNAVVLVIVIADSGATHGATEWLGLMVLLSCARAILYFRYKADPDKPAHTDTWERLAVAGSFGAGLLWGLGPILPFGEISDHLWFWAFVIAGMSAGATTLHAAHLPTALAFIIPASLPLAFSLLMQGSLQGYAAAILTVAFIATMTFTATLFSRDFARAQELKFDLQARARELDETNRRLSLEMADHRKTSEALHQSQKMDALGNLTGGLAHDFNNILTVVISNLDMIASHSEQPRIKGLALSAMGAAESGADLLARLLAFARKRTLEPTHVNVVEAVSDFRDLLLHAVSGSNEVQFESAQPVAVASIDLPQFQAMLLNLVVNARDAMPRGGLITITVAQVALDGDALKGTDAQPGDFIAIAVRDTGTGMAPEALARAFEPFYTTKADRGGTGLGLSQVYGFARQSGGFGRIESEPDRGTCVTILLPARDPSLAAGQADVPPAPPAQVYSLLLVDDNLAVLNAIADGLCEEGWKVMSASDPHAALAIAAGHHFDIVVTDVDMPGDMSGAQLADELRRLHPGLPILLMSGAALASDAPGADLPFLAKPFRKKALTQKLQSLIDGRMEE